MRLILTILGKIFGILGVEVSRKNAIKRDSLKCAIDRVKHLNFGAVIDVGAAYGDFIKLASSKINAHYWAIEPVQEYKDTLKQVLSGLPKANYCMVAAGSENSKRTINLW